MDLGIHMGDRISRDAEALYFRGINRSIIRSQNANWDQPQILTEAMRSTDILESQSQRLRQEMMDKSIFLGNRPSFSRHFGNNKWALIMSHSQVAWGWNDPQTSLLIPIWTDIFPEAKWIHLIRNGIDVSISLFRKSWKQQRRWLYPLFRSAYRENTLDFQYCFNLWEEYLCTIYDNFSTIDNSRKIDIKYEELIQKPEAILNRLISFLGLSISEEMIHQASRQVESETGNSFQNIDVFITQITSVPTSFWMKLLGYSA